MLRTCHLDHLSVVCVQKVYCGKTADWIQMPFGGGDWGRAWYGCMVLDFGGDCRRGRGNFAG